MHVWVYFMRRLSVFWARLAYVRCWQGEIRYYAQIAKLASPCKDIQADPSGLCSSHLYRKYTGPTALAFYAPLDAGKIRSVTPTSRSTLSIVLLPSCASSGCTLVSIETIQRHGVLYLWYNYRYQALWSHPRQCPLTWCFPCCCCCWHLPVVMGASQAVQLLRAPMVRRRLATVAGERTCPQFSPPQLPLIPAWSGCKYLCTCTPALLAKNWRLGVCVFRAGWLYSLSKSWPHHRCMYNNRLVRFHQDEKKNTWLVLRPQLLIRNSRSSLKPAFLISTNDPYFKHIAHPQNS